MRVHMRVCTHSSSFCTIVARNHTRNLFSDFQAMRSWDALLGNKKLPAKEKNQEEELWKGMGNALLLSLKLPEVNSSHKKNKLVVP